MVLKKKKTNNKRKNKKTTNQTPEKVSFEITVPVRNVTKAQAAKIKADAKKKLTGAKFKAITKRRRVKR